MKQIILTLLFLFCQLMCCNAQTDYKMAGPYEVVARDGKFANTKAGCERDMFTALAVAKEGRTEQALEIINAYANGNWGAIVNRCRMACGIFLQDKDIYKASIDYCMMKGIEYTTKYNLGYVSAMNNTEGRTISVPTDFLSHSYYMVDVFNDDSTLNTRTNVSTQTIKIKAGNPTTLQLQPSGGAALHFKKIKK